MKGILTRNTHVQYENPASSGLKVMAKAKVVQTSKNMVQCERSCHKEYACAI